MPKPIALITLLLASLVTPPAWSQDDPGNEEGQMQESDEFSSLEEDVDAESAEAADGQDQDIEADDSGSDNDDVGDQPETTSEDADWPDDTAPSVDADDAAPATANPASDTQPPPPTPSGPAADTASDSTGNVRLTEVSDDSFADRVTMASTPALVLFCADMSAACREIAPLLEDVARAYGGRVQIFRMDVEANTDIPAKYAIRSIPTLMLIKGGDIAATQTGALSKTQLTEFLDQNL